MRIVLADEGINLISNKYVRTGNGCILNCEVCHFLLSSIDEILQNLGMFISPSLQESSFCIDLYGPLLQYYNITTVILMLYIGTS